jgi:F-type H+-transporting ATPase subunit b
MEIASGVLSKLGFDWQVALANLVNFLIVYFLLKKVVFNKLRDAILERKAKAQEGVRLREEAALLNIQAQEMKEEMKKEVAHERRELLDRVEKERTFLLDKTNHEITQLKKQAHDDGVKEKERIIQEAEGDIVDISISFVKKILEGYQEKPDMSKIELLTRQATQK